MRNENLIPDFTKCLNGPISQGQSIAYLGLDSYESFHFAENLPFFDLRKYKQTKLIGKANSYVYLYESNQQEPSQVAVKFIKVPDKFLQIFSISEQDKLRLKLHEIYNLQSVNHPNLVQIYGFAQKQEIYFEGKTNKCNIRFFFFFFIFKEYLICMEYLPFDLKQRIDYLRLQENSAPKEEIEQALSQLTEAYLFLQLQQYCHTDIKPENILINSLEQPNVYKVCDLDSFAQFAKTSRYQSYNITTLKYQPPEIKNALKNGFDQIDFNAFKSDMFSLGLCIVQLHFQINICGDNEPGTTKYVFQKFIKNQRFQYLASRQIANLYGKQLGRFVEKMLDPDNSKRPDFFQLNKSLKCEGISSRNISLMSLQRVMTPQHNLKNTNSYNSRNTLDWNDYKEKKIRKQDNSTSIKTLSSDHTSQLSIIPNESKANRVLSVFARQILDSKIQALKLQTSIEEELQEQDHSKLSLEAPKKNFQTNLSKFARQAKVLHHQFDQKIFSDSEGESVIGDQVQSPVEVNVVKQRHTQRKLSRSQNQLNIKANTQERRSETPQAYANLEIEIFIEI